MQMMRAPYLYPNTKILKNKFFTICAVCIFRIYNIIDQAGQAKPSKGK